MKMNRGFILAAAVAVAAATAVPDVCAQEAPKPINAKVTDATVYFRGAELTHAASVPVAKGANEIVIEGLSPSIDVSTLRVKASGGAVISSTEFSIDYTAGSKTANAELKKLEAELEKYRAEQSQVNIELGINSQMLNYLKSGVQKNVSGSEEGMGVDELIKTMEYYKKQATELESEKVQLNKRSTELNEKINNLLSQISQERIKGNKTSGVLRVNLSSPISSTSQFTITYFTPAASWQPLYDINITSVESPVGINTRAKVSQTTGLDWEKVKLTLSTAVPSNGKIAPLFSAWFLREESPAYQTRNLAQNMYSYAEESVELSEVVVVGYSSAKQQDSVDGSQMDNSILYLIDGSIMDEEQFMYVDQQYIKSMEVVTDSSTKRRYGNPGTLINVTLKEMDDFVSNEDNDLNTVFNIDIAYTVPGNGKEQTIDIKRQQTTAKYNYYCAPKLDGSTYMLAKLTGWENLGLMSGNANITYDGTYIGQTYINTASTQSDLTLTLGTEPRVTVKREKLKEYSTSRVIGSNIQQTYAFKITVRNNRNTAVDMVVKEQYPISTNKSIEVTLNTKETTKWTANVENLGVISWEERLEPGESREYTISYTVKYPKGMNINL